MEVKITSGSLRTQVRRNWGERIKLKGRMENELSSWEAEFGRTNRRKGISSEECSQTYMSRKYNVLDIHKLGHEELCPEC